MSPTIRRILGILVGLCVGVIVIMGIEALGARIFPLPTRVNPEDPEAVRAAMDALPFGAFLFVLVAWASGTLAAAFTATLIDRTTSRVPAFVVGSGLFLGAVITMLSLPHPGWFSVVAVLMFAPLAILGHRLAVGRAFAPA